MVFMTLSAIGFILSLIAHLCGLCGVLPRIGFSIWTLHVGIFAIWIPAVLVSIKMNRGVNQKDYWKNILAGCPRWMRRTVYVLVAYTVINFIFFIVTTPKQNFSSSHNEPTPAILRGFSGHWMLFYGVGFATLYSAYTLGWDGLQRRCRNGHPVSLVARFCEQCGEPLDEINPS